MHDELLFSLKSFHMSKDKSILLLKCSLERKLDEQTLMNHYLVLVHLLSISFGSHFQPNSPLYNCPNLIPIFLLDFALPLPPDKCSSERYRSNSYKAQVFNKQHMYAPSSYYGQGNHILGGAIQRPLSRVTELDTSMSMNWTYFLSSFDMDYHYRQEISLQNDFDD